MPQPCKSNCDAVTISSALGAVAGFGVGFAFGFARVAMR
jgi:hypothetical protein